MVADFGADLDSNNSTITLNMKTNANGTLNVSDAFGLLSVPIRIMQL